MKKIAMAAILMTIGAPVCAEVETTIGADVVSGYVWRGIELGNAAVQPSLGLSAGGFGLSFWGSTGIVDFLDTKEFDITLSYSILKHRRLRTADIVAKEHIRHEPEQ